MTDRPRRGRLSLAVGAVAALAGIAVAVLVVVLSTDVLDEDDSCKTPSAAPPAETALMPAKLSFDQIGTVTSVEKDDRHVTLEAVTTKPIDEVTVLIQDAVTAAGYRPAGMDNEGFEAEVFFTTGSLAAGQARVERAACEGRWDIELTLLDRNAER